MKLLYGPAINAEITPKIGLAIADMTFHSNIEVAKSQLAYTQGSLVADIGGYLGLLLGVSLMDITRVANYLCMKLFTKLP